MVAECVSRLVPVLRGAGQLCTIAPIPRRASSDVAPRTAPSQSTRSPPDLGKVFQVKQTLATDAEDPASLSQRAVCRSTSEVGAVCGSSARTDLCGGRPEMAVPTAIAYNEDAAKTG